MGLDWNPLPRPRAGYEDEFARLFDEIDGRVPPQRSFFGRLLKGKTLTDGEFSQRMERMNEIGEAPQASVGAPVVGRDAEADDWLRERLEGSGRLAELDEARAEMDGYHVVELAPDCDGFPIYSNAGLYPGIDRLSFRAQFLNDVEAELGELFEQAWANKTAAELEAYGAEMIAIAERLAATHSVPLTTDTPDEADEESPEHKVSVLLSAGRWCVFWGSRGHALHAWF